MATQRSLHMGEGSVQQRISDPTMGEIDMGNLNVSEMQAASWGASWGPDARDWWGWPEIEEWPPPDESASQSADAPDAWPIFERFGERRLVLIGR